MFLVMSRILGTALAPVKHREEKTTLRSVTPRAKTVDVDLAPPTKRVPPKVPEGEYPSPRDCAFQLFLTS